jgi:hypothetical protein
MSKGRKILRPQHLNLKAIFLAFYPQNQRFAGFFMPFMASLAFLKGT